MNITVFIAEDHAVVCDSMKYMLEAQDNISVVGCAYDGREAIQKILQVRPKITMMDIIMPRLNGIEATYELTTVCPTTQVIILSMYASSDYISRSLEAGARGYVLKDSLSQELITAIHDVSNGHRYLSPKIADCLVDDYVRARTAGPHKDLLERLSHREREVLQLVVEGSSTTAIAEMLFLSPKTVETYRSRLMNKLGIDDLPTLVKFAIRNGLISLD